MTVGRLMAAAGMPAIEQVETGAWKVGKRLFSVQLNRPRRPGGGFDRLWLAAIELSSLCHLP